MADGVPFFKRKLFGKIPYLYVAGGVVVVLAVIAWRMKQSTAETPSDSSTADNTDSGDTVDPTATDIPANTTSTGGFVANPQPALAQDNTTGNATIQDNDTWLRKSVEYLTGLGKSAGGSQVALQKYLDGEQLSYDEGELRDLAVKQYGVPPEPFKAGPTAGKPSAPAQKQGPLPRDHEVKGPNDNSYAKLAQLYYGSQTRDAINLIKAANTPQAPWGNDETGFAVGVKVRIPVWITPKYFTSTKTIDTLREISSKNGTNDNDVLTLNPGMKFPVKPGTRVRVK